MKNIFVRQRPNILRLTDASGYSFPSGHSMASMVFYGFLIYLIYLNIKSKKIKISLICFLVLLIMLIGLSRIYLGVHYPSDVCGGFLMGLAYLVIFTKIYKEFRKDKQTDNMVIRGECISACAYLKEKGIKVIAVCPHWTKTEFFDTAVVDDTIKYYNTYNTPTQVVSAAINNMKKGKDVSLVGAKVKNQIFLVKHFSHKFVMKTWCNQQKFNKK
jgi:prepilin signal peptidase PulO-like enzyme (type II secretory pathway)